MKPFRRNPPQVQAHSRKPHSWRKRVLPKIIERDGAFCRSCGCAQSFTYKTWGQSNTADGHRFSWVYRVSLLELDHITPLHLGGDNEVSNLQLLCHECHKRKTSAERSVRMKAFYAEARAA